ncbi:ABC transporter substrate-binding protein [Frankia sp. R82]|uniref:ABC transporter substrate-binding protein n=1 Tax=Frankia sp. R82 TaxID=2950553 RepID=UPI002044942B|nr:ABC transporter substrate-binding protein [Frankia sp. R82]MCM3883251.1 ABC transporter substrate-binding protein [Frankia sp. R82]
MSIRALSVLPVALLCLSALIGCSTDSATSAADCNGPGVSPSGVKVGLIYPDTGPLAPIFQATRSGLNARLGVANAAGGVNGRTISYEWADDRGRADTNSVVSRDLVDNRNSFAILESTATSSGGAGFLASRGIPVIGVAAEPVWAQYRNMFTYSYSQGTVNSTDTITTFGKFARQSGGTRALVVVDPAGIGVSDQTSRQLQGSFESVGLPVSTAPADETPTQNQIDEIVRKVAADKVDTLVSALSIDSFAKIVAAVRHSGASPRLILSSSQAPSSQLLQEYGSLLSGLTVYTAQAIDPTSPGFTAYRDAMARYSPDQQDTSETLARVGYIIGDMLVRGLQEAGPCPTRAAFITHLRAVKDYSAGGLITPIDFDQDFGKLPICYPFTTVNAAGNGMITTAANFCGERVSS